MALGYLCQMLPDLPRLVPTYKVVAERRLTGWPDKDWNAVGTT